MIKKTREVVDFQSAMKNLTLLAEMDLADPPSFGISKGLFLIVEDPMVSSKGTQWVSAEGSEPFFEALEESYRVTFEKVVTLYRERSEDCWDRIESILWVAGESARKIDQYLEMRLGKNFEPKIATSHSFLELNRFYLNHFVKQPVASSKTKHELDPLREDLEYELFFLKTGTGEPCLSHTLLKDLQLQGDFGPQEGEFEEDPFLRVLPMLDRDIHVAAQFIIRESTPLIRELFKRNKSLANTPFVQELRKSIFALSMAANPHHLLQNGSEKGCIGYFRDFQKFLRAAIRNEEYQKRVCYPLESSHQKTAFLLSLVHSLCFHLCTRFSGIRQEMLGLIHRTMRKTPQASKWHKDLFHVLLEKDEQLRHSLSKFSNGPLLKTLETLKSYGKEICFDPMLQGMPPLFLYCLQAKEQKIRVYASACPVEQKTLSKADLTPEFQGFLRQLKEDHRKGLWVNFQEHGSLKERARCHVMEALQKQKEWEGTYFCLTLSKGHPFFAQDEEEQILAKVFLEDFLQKLEHPHQIGIVFPEGIQKKEWHAFSKKAIHWLHEEVFNAKEQLSQKERRAFLDLWSSLLILHIVQKMSPDLLVFMSKDGTDLASSEAAQLYGMLLLQTKQTFEKLEIDFLLWILYAPALLVRERALQIQPCMRCMYALKYLEPATESYRKIFRNLTFSPDKT